MTTTGTPYAISRLARTYGWKPLPAAVRQAIYFKPGMPLLRVRYSAAGAITSAEVLKDGYDPVLIPPPRKRQVIRFLEL